MYPLILEYDNAIDQEDLDAMINIAKSSTSLDWSKMDNVEETGPFWLGKRMMISETVLPSWHEKIVSLRSEIDFFNITEPRKIQRFNNGDFLGPLIDGEHVDSIKHGAVLFLNEPKGSEIYFPRINYKVKAKANRLVVYGGDQEYIIRGPEGKDYLYFSTVFMS
jgi:hypothetical protein